MLHVFTHAEYADMVFVYRFCNGNALAVGTEYSLRFPNHRVPDSRVFCHCGKKFSTSHTL